MTKSLKTETGTAFVWSLLDRGGLQVIQLAFMMVLARCLSAADFGAIAVLSIFMAIAGLLQESGFSSALIRKKIVSPQEYTAVFYFNISLSILVYIVLFLLAPLISNFYNQPALTWLARFIFITFVLNSFGIVQNVNMVRAMNFKTNTKITFIAGIVAGIVAVAMALKGYRAWSLATQVVLQALLRNVLLWVFIKWQPQGKFNIQPIKDMFAYSSKLLASAFLTQISNHIYANIIGKEFSISQAGIYDRGAKLNIIPQSAISDGINGVTSPLLTKLEDDKQRIKAFRKIMRITAFVVFPVALMLIVAAHPIVIIAFSAKWIEAIPILQLLAVGGAVFPLTALLGRMLQYKGKSGHILAMEMIRNVLLLSAVFFTISYGVQGLVAGMSVVQLIAFVVAIYMVWLVTDYSLWQVLKDITPYLFAAVIAFAPFYFASLYLENIYLLAMVQMGGGSLIYLLLVRLLGSKVLADCISFIKNRE